MVSIFGSPISINFNILKPKKENNYDISVSRRFSTWPWQKYYILAVHQYKRSDNEPSGYKHLGQNSRPDQWRKLIEIKTSFLGFKRKIILIPKNPDDILTVVISRNGVERWKTIKFNQ